MNTQGKRTIIGFTAGLVFGAGLAMSGMTDTSKVLGFLDISGAWQADLMFVMGGALVVTLIAFQWIKRHKQPLFDKQFYLPTKTKLDAPLIVGAAIFGIGWGVYGYCPGPAIASLAYFKLESIVFVIAMIAGMGIANLLPKPK